MNMKIDVKVLIDDVLERIKEKKIDKKLINPKRRLKSNLRRSVNKKKNLDRYDLLVKYLNEGYKFYKILELDEKVGYIYKITCKITGNIYVGSTTRTPKKRFEDHLFTFLRGKNYTKLYESFDEHGEKNHILEQVEKVKYRTFLDLL